MSDYLAIAAAHTERVRAQSPLVHNITNFVVMHTTANALLSIGASPVMAHAVEEVEEITSLASSLVLNIGTLSTSWIEAMYKALATATERDIPVVLDPVGAGASTMRTEAACGLLAKMHGGIVRGNASEILAVAGAVGNTRGVDSTASVADAVEAAQCLAQAHQCIVCVSGAEDIVTDGASVIGVKGGSPMMTRVTGLGCTATAIVAAYAGVCDQDAQLPAVVSAMAAMSCAGSLAAEVSRGPGSFLPAFLDALYGFTASDLANYVSITYR